MRKANELLVPRELLPLDLKEWHGFLRDYFCDKDAAATLVGNGVRLQLAWPSEVSRHVDPELETGLKRLSRSVEVSSMWSEYWREGKILTALYDTWTLYSWSKWLARTPANLAKDVVLLHVDDHRDLGSPRLIAHDGTVTDAITGAIFDLLDPTSVRKAIESGAVGMGSFMTPFIHAVPSAEVRHLCQPPKGRQTTEFSLRPATRADTLLREGEDRLSIEWEVSQESGLGSYLVTSDVGLWSEGIAGRLALLHIDMDYFNNRYDGDSDWRDRPDRLDPDLETIRERIDEMVDAIRCSEAVIEDVTIAYSPGFFPAEFWRPAEEWLRSGLRKARKSSPPRICGRAKLRPVKRCSDQPKVQNEDVLLVPVAGTPGKGKGSGGEKWRIDVAGMRAGVVYINVIDDPLIGRHASIQIYLNIKSQGRGIGRLGYLKACQLSQHPTIYAHMRKSNIASRRAAEAADFVDATPRGYGQLIMVRRKAAG